MSTKPLVIVLGNDDDAADHSICFRETERRDTAIRRIHPNELTTCFDEDGTSFWSYGKRIYPDLVLGWVFDDILLPGMRQLEAFERAGVLVVNTARTLFRGQNKYLTSALLHAAGVEHLPVISGLDVGSALRWAEKQKFPIVAKPIVGFGGNGVAKFENMNALRTRLEQEHQGMDHFYLQPYIRHPGRDIRVLCVNYHAVAAFYRYPFEGEWITTVGGCGRRELLDEIPAELADVAQRASRAVGARISGVDLAEDLDTGRYRVLEVNTCPCSARAYRQVRREPLALCAQAEFLAALAHGGPDVLSAWVPPAEFLS
jgi:RimK family alpha-L-glutamate ligase